MMRVIDRCRSCGHPDLFEVLSLGQVPLANALLKESELGQPEPRFPLTLVLCPTCHLVQLRETIDPEVLFRHYLYFSSFSDTMLDHAREIARRMRERLGLDESSLVVEIASNDGYLLKNFVEARVPVLGIEPARNVADVAIRNGVNTISEFFGLTLATKLAHEGRRADLIIANNVLAHVADLNGVATGIAHLLKPDGCAVIEFPYLGDMIAGTEFDTIYHEHLCYFSLHAAGRLFERCGLLVTDVERLDIHGGSLRIFVEHARPGREASPRARDLLASEVELGLNGLTPFQQFASSVKRLKTDLRRHLEARKATGKSLAAYGASAKGTTLLNTFRIGSDLLDFVVDRSTVKHGLFTPGTHLPILPPAELLSRRPDVVLLLTWNFADEIFRQQREYLQSGGEFVVPVPEVRSVSKEDVA